MLPVKYFALIQRPPNTEEPDTVTDGQLQNTITNCTEVSRIGKTRSYKLRFSRREDTEKNSNTKKNNL